MLYDYDDETIELYYDGIEVEWASGDRDYWFGDYSRYGTSYVSVTIEVSKYDVMEYISTLLTEDDKEGFVDDMENEELFDYIYSRFDELFEKYEDKILARYEEEAEEKAYQEYDPDDYEPDYDDYDDDF